MWCPCRKGVSPVLASRLTHFSVKSPPKSDDFLNPVHYFHSGLWNLVKQVLSLQRETPHCLQPKEEVVLQPEPLKFAGILTESSPNTLLFTLAGRPSFLHTTHSLRLESLISACSSKGTSKAGVIEVVETRLRFLLVCCAIRKHSFTIASLKAV
jgi:hypothetical protein